MNTKLSTSAHLLLIALVAALSFFAACSDECDNLRKDVDDLRLRVEKLEDWCSSANSQISALQGLVAALEANDYVTGITPVMEGTLETGYTIQFSKSGPITIRHGKDGTNGLTPLIGTAKDTDGRYYWTVQTGDADPQWLTDAEGNKIPTTGKDGSDGTDARPPAISVATFEGSLYWQVNGQWLLDNNHAKVPATGPAGTAGSQGPQGNQGIQGPAGPQGDAVFAPDGVAVDDENGYVTFTLADKVTTFRLPLYGATVIRFESNEPLLVNEEEGGRATILLPQTFTKDDYSALMAEVVEADSKDGSLVTRVGPWWDVKLDPPTFNPDGTLATQPVVHLTPYTRSAKYLLRVTLVHPDGHESTVSRVIILTEDIVYDYTIEEQLTEPGEKPKYGNGTASNPYLIETKKELQWVKQNPGYASYYYKLTKNIQVTGTDSQGNWVPIGKELIPDRYGFGGQFDGNGKKVSGIVASAGYLYFGFFGTCEKAEIRNLTYEGSMDLSRLDDRTNAVGAIAGSISDGTITHCSNSADLTCKEDVSVGGIVGYLSSSSHAISIEACTNTGNIETTEGHAGGIAGEFTPSNSSLVGCINTGNIKTNGPTYVYAGGIVGQVEGSVVSCWSKATSITHQNNGKVGGIVGGMSGMNTTVKACLWKYIPGMDGIGNILGLTITESPYKSFTGDRPDAEGIRQMDEAWKAQNPGREYRFNATTGEIEPK